MNNKWADKIIDKVYIFMDYKNARKHHAKVEYHFEGDEYIYPITLYGDKEIDECLNAFTKQTGLNKFQLEKYENKLFYFDKDNYKDPNSHVIENDLVNNGITKGQIGKVRSSYKIVRNFKKVATVATLAALLVGGYKLIKGLNKENNFCNYRNPDKKIEMMADKKVVDGSSRAKDIFYRLLEKRGSVSTNDMDFLIDYMTYASMTNSDYQHNASYTELFASNILYQELESSRDKFQNQSIMKILSNEKYLYNNTIIPSYYSERYSFNEDEAYKYFVYVTSLIRGGEDTQYVYSKYYDQGLLVATKKDSAVFKNIMTPLEKITFYTKIKGFLNGDFEFKFKRDCKLSSYDLDNYSKKDYLAWIDSQIKLENQKIMQEGIKNTGKSR